MTTSFLSGVVGQQAVEDQWQPGSATTDQKHPLGQVVDIFDTVYGPRRVIYALSASALVYGNPVVFSKTADATGAFNLTATTAPTALPTSVPIGFAATAFSGANQYGWFVINGGCAVASDSSFAAGAATFVHAAGRLGITGVGKQVVGVQILEASSRTITKTAQGSSGDTWIRVPDESGWFVGMRLTGTGIGASANITKIEPGGRITLSVANSAAVNGTVTGTFNDGTIYWNTAFVNAPAGVI